jgi:ribosome biogenesis GTPase
MPEGRIMKALSGFYYVRDAEQFDKTYQCQARGIFRKKEIVPLVGDLVTYVLVGNEQGSVTGIHPRTSELIRPPVSNVDQAVLVFSLEEPEFNPLLLDKFLVHTEKAGLDSIICLTKKDLFLKKGHSSNHDSSSLELAVERIKSTYETIGYPVFVTSMNEPEGIDHVNEQLAGKISVFAGQSGVGKSSLLNVIMPHLQLATAAISKKLGRGKHTTRHVELIPLANGGLVADTPGFSQLDFSGVDAAHLGGYFKEFRPLSQDCKFRGCCHVREPGCGVKRAIEAGAISQSRYEHYVAFLEEIKDQKPKY